jgi:hypothetical protein
VVHDRASVHTTERPIVSRLFDHMRRNLVAYLALFVALGGTGYAAANLPAGSVGTAQLRSGAITPPKFDRHLIGGYVRAWAVTNNQCQVVASSPAAVMTPKGTCSGNGPYSIVWKGKFPKQSKSCAAIGVPHAPPPGIGPPQPTIYADYVGHGIVNMTFVNPVGPGQGVSVALIC